MTTPHNSTVQYASRPRPAGGDFFCGWGAGRLTLSDGAVFPGRIPPWQAGTFTGEAVFTTGMTGYVESLTDPSYAGQILVFTYPLIGNYGALSEASWESDNIHVAGVIMSELCRGWSHPQSRESLLAWLRREHVPVLAGADTRALTKHLRSHGVMQGAITRNALRHPLRAARIPFISVAKPEVHNPERERTVILVDCGMKRNILRALTRLPVSIKRVPHDYDYSKEAFAGVVISNGPGDPADYRDTIRIARKAMRRELPIFGICLGSQIMALAAGAKTYKLPFGHRGHNQPVAATGAARRCFITSQNHGYAVDEKTLPPDWRVTFRNLNDHSVEGLAHTTKPFFSVQFHPEANPGPTDTRWLFEEFTALL